jgi:DNA (cytosine-5)-methyltransferase 1
VLKASDCGIPQSRERVFVVSIHKDATMYQHFSFEKVQKKELQPLTNFLENNVDKSYFIKQKSMVKAIEQGKIKIIDNVVSTITTKQ